MFDIHLLITKRPLFSSVSKIVIFTNTIRCQYYKLFIYVRITLAVIKPRRGLRESVPGFGRYEDIDRLNQQIYAFAFYVG